MYTMIARRKNTAGITLSAILLFAGLSVLAFGIIIREKNSAVQFLSLVPLSAFVLTLQRYVFTSYEYAVGDGLLTISEKSAKRLYVVARIGIEDIEDIIAVTDRKLPKEIRKKSRIYDYRPEICPKKFCAITVTKPSYCDNGRTMCILIQPDEKMLRILRS